MIYVNERFGILSQLYSPGTAPPQIVAGPPNVSVKVGATITLTATISGVPAPEVSKLIMDRGMTVL